MTLDSISTLQTSIRLGFQSNFLFSSHGYGKNTFPHTNMPFLKVRKICVKSHDKRIVETNAAIYVLSHRLGHFP